MQIDGRSTVAALRTAVLEVAEGDTTAYAGQSGYPGTNPDDEAAAGFGDTYGEFELTPASGGGPGIVGVNVQHSSILDGYPFNCSYEWMVDCETQDLPRWRQAPHLPGGADGGRRRHQRGRRVPLDP